MDARDEANSLIQSIKAISMSRLSLEEMIFFANNVRLVAGELYAVSEFSEADLAYLRKIIARHLFM